MYTFTKGSKIYNCGDITETAETFHGNPFFRKVFYNDQNNPESRKAAYAEIQISRILMNNPHPNIVTFYEINDNYVEMELLDVETTFIPKETMEKVKDFLQSLGIIYIDWKIDNIGISHDGTYKLFDFNVSGLVDLKTNDWIIKPLEYWSYNKAIENGYASPQDIDDYSFIGGLRPPTQMDHKDGVEIKMEDHI